MSNAGIIYKVLRRRVVMRRHREERPFDSSSIADMAFLLLIFFIVTGSFILRQGIFMSLPSKTAGAMKMDPAKIIEVWPENGGFMVEGKLLDRKSFSELVTRHGRAWPDGVMVIKMKDTVKYHRLVDTLSVARETGLKRISMKDAGAGGGR